MFEASKGEANRLERRDVEEGLQDYSDRQEEGGAFMDDSLESFFDFINEDVDLSEQQRNEFSQIDDPIERLEFLSHESLANGIQLVREYPISAGASTYLHNRIRFYWRLFGGQATK